MMEIGMLWFNNDKKRPLDERIAEAVAYYKDKYGIDANLCFVHPETIPTKEKSMDCGGVEVRASNTLLPNHFWIGHGTD